MKKALIFIFIIIVLGFLAFPIVFRMLEPYEYSAAGDTVVGRSYIWGNYGYIRVLLFLVPVSILYWIIATILLGKPDEE